MDISQPKSGKDVFGIQEYKGEDELGKFTVSDLWTRTDEGAVSYKYGYPIYKMGDEYHTELYGYEVYTTTTTERLPTTPSPSPARLLLWPTRCRATRPSWPCFAR